MTDSTRQFERDRLFKKWGQFIVVDFKSLAYVFAPLGFRPLSMAIKQIDNRQHQTALTSLIDN